MKGLRITISSLAAGTALLLATGAGLRAADQPPAEGTMAPDFTLKSQEGTPITLHDYRGKWVVLYFYPKDMTQGCTIEAPASSATWLNTSRRKQ
jgi:peroxiredoxin Q/BCP